MAELGQTTDPKALVPGDPEAVYDTARQLRAKATVMQQVADDLGNIRIDGWTGPASSRFWDAFAPEKANWLLGRDAMNTVASTLDGHASTLSWAQSQAADAIDLWERGQQATRQAVADYRAGSGPLVAPPAPGGLPLGLADPGAPLRQRARDILDRARKQLKDAGRSNAAAIAAQGGQGKGAPGWLSGPAGFVDKAGAAKVSDDIKATDSLMDKAQRGDKFTKYGQWGQKFEDQAGPKVKATLWEGSAEASLFQREAKGATQVAGVNLLGQADIKALSAQASASYGIGSDGIFGEAKAGAYLLSASAKGSAQFGIAEVGGSANGFVGAEAGVEGSISPDGAKVGVNAFAGAKAAGEAHADIGGVGAGITGEAWAGAGAEANAQIGMDNGKFTIGAEAGLGLGVGAKLGFEVTVDPKKVTDTVSDAVGAINPFD